MNNLSDGNAAIECPVNVNFKYKDFDKWLTLCDEEAFRRYWLLDVDSMDGDDEGGETVKACAFDLMKDGKKAARILEDGFLNDHEPGLVIDELVKNGPGRLG